jgi:choline-sulfatase
MDEQIGRVLAELHNLGLKERTLVVLAGDYGEGLGEHGESQHGYFLYETTRHVPLMMRCPGKVAPATSVADVVRTIDIAPTILELLHLPAFEHAQGESLVSRMCGQRGADLYAYSETLEPHGAFGLSRLRAETTADWKFVLAPTPKLYHLADDPHEMYSVAAEHPDVAERMRQEIRDLIAEAPAPVHDAGPSAGLGDADRARL